MYPENYYITTIRGFYDTQSTQEEYNGYLYCLLARSAYSECIRGEGERSTVQQPQESRRRSKDRDIRECLQVADISLRTVELVVYLCMFSLLF